MIEVDIMNHHCVCCKEYIKIINSYQIPDDKILIFLIRLKAEIGNRIIYNRSIESWHEEWVCNNIFYNLDIYRSTTKDVCLKDDLSHERELAYKNLYYLYEKVKLIKGKDEK